ncbi:pheromone A receptor-domain-containing protein [Schizophyllum amplum]|uniref:Pheromone A receptor-domain-containing protein n=1 Tax=Schizophyllum amplum TaxID=97359 RepID=A0A550C0K1_9AGAR|nr:pheromone A receptor-domain-containing protein [Auriculariopsis ampla]
MSYPNWVFSMFMAFGTVITLLPLPWHLEAWNTGTCLYMIWVSVACLVQLVNSIVWSGNAINWAPIWCDISARIIIGTSVAIPAASLVINRRLYCIATVRTVTKTKPERRREVMMDMLIGMGIPVLVMILQYIPQGHRFDIYEDIGCYPTTYNTWVAIVCVTGWPIAIGCVSAIYCTLSIYNFNKRRRHFNEYLAAHSNLTANRYFRLMCLAAIEICLTIPLGAFGIYMNTQFSSMQPWISWEDTHLDFSNVQQVPAILWKSVPTTYQALELSRWFIFVCAFIFFLFFGFAEEARKNYRLAMYRFCKRAGYVPRFLACESETWSPSASPGKYSGSGPSMPVYANNRKQSSTRVSTLFSDLTADEASSYRESHDEKLAAGGTLSYGQLSLGDVGGILSDSKEEPLSPITTAGCSNESSTTIQHGPAHPPALTAPEPARLRPHDMRIEISSIRSSTISMSGPATSESYSTAAEAHRAGEIV